MTQYIYVCTGARVGHRLERAANMIIILLLLTIINIIHILTSLTLWGPSLNYCAHAQDRNSASQHVSAQ